MDEMKIGDIGVLQNITGKNSVMNGNIAEVVLIKPDPLLSERSIYGVKDFLSPSGHDTKLWGIKKHQIRKLSNPDAEQPTEQDEELAV